MNYKTYETKRLKILPTSENDTQFILELMNSPKWLKFIGDKKIKTIEDAHNYIKTKITPQFEK